MKRGHKDSSIICAARERRVVHQRSAFSLDVGPGRKWWTINAVDANSMPPQQQPDEGEIK
jgi:hypothetical protein